MDGSTPPGPPVSGSSVVIPPPTGDLLFPAPADAAWEPGSPDVRRSRRVVVGAALATVLVLVAVVLLGLRALGLGAGDSGVGVTATSVGDLTVGTCYRLRAEDRTADSVGAVDAVPCTTPHDGQVYARVPLDFDSYPADIELTSTADAGCADQDAAALDPAVDSVDTISATWYAPLEADWAESPHVATCVIESDDPDGLTRSWTSAARA
jgi:hypothetical protein